MVAPSSSEAPLRVALAGYGLAGATFHAPLIAATGGLELSAVVTRDAQRREQLAAAHPGARAVEALEDALDDAELVVVASPNRFHVELATAALEAGRHVVVDKPVALDAAQARELAERAGEVGRLVIPFHNRRWDDDYLTLGRVVHEGRLGHVLRFESRFDRWRPQVRAGVWREAGGPAEGGGLLLDLGTHLVDQAVQLLGPVTSVYAELDRRRPGAEVEDDIFVALAHVGGARSHLWAGVHAAHPAPRFRVLGDRASYVSQGLDPQEAQLRAGTAPGDAAFGHREPDRAATLHDGEGGAERLAMERGRWTSFYPGVVAAIRDGARPPVALDDAVGVLTILDAARQSAAAGTVVAVA